MAGELLLLCFLQTAQVLELPPSILMAINKVESGKPGLATKNKNGTFDYGLMQINSIWLEDLAVYFQISKTEVTYNLLVDDCFNIMAGGLILKKNINESGEFWQGVGWYHSRTPTLSVIYLKKINRALSEVSQNLKKRKTNVLSE